LAYEAEHDKQHARVENPASPAPLAQVQLLKLAPHHPIFVLIADRFAARFCRRALVGLLQLLEPPLPVAHKLMMPFGSDDQKTNHIQNQPDL
jgi:hypothetical protein